MPRWQHSNPQRRQQEQHLSPNSQLSGLPAGSGKDLAALVTSCACMRCSFFQETFLCLGHVRAVCLAPATQIPQRLACPRGPPQIVLLAWGASGTGRWREHVATPSAAEGPAGGSARFPQGEVPLFQSLSSLCTCSNSSPKQTAKKDKKNMKGLLLMTGGSPSWCGAPSLRTQGYEEDSSFSTSPLNI